MKTLVTRVLAVTILSAALCGCGQEAVGEEADGPVVIGGWSNAKESSDWGPGPWYFELGADVVALGTIGEPFEHGGRRLLRLDLTEVLKGKATIQKISPEDAMPWFGCVGPPDPLPRPSDRLGPGSMVLVYMTGREKDLSIMKIERVPDSVDHLRRFFKLLEEIHGPNPDWDALLADEVTVDQATLYAFGSPPKEAGPALCARLERTVTRLKKDPKPLEAEALAYVAALVYRLKSKATLKSVGALLTWLSDADLGTFGVYARSLIPPKDVLALLDQKTARQWSGTLQEIASTARGGSPHAYAEATRALSELPGDPGIPFLIDELSHGRFDMAPGLVRWAKATRRSPSPMRTKLGKRVAKLAADPKYAGEEFKHFRRYLGEILQALG